MADLAAIDGIGGFVFDVDGTLARRRADGRAEPMPGAAEVLARLRASGRPFVLFTNASHVAADEIARRLRADGLEVGGEEVLTPIESAIYHLGRHHRGAPVLALASDAARERLRAAGVALVEAARAEVVFVAHLDDVDLDDVDAASHAVASGAPLLTGSYAPGYAGADGIIFSRGAMVTAAIAKVTGARPRVLGKPSRAAVAEVTARLGLKGKEIAMVGDDAGMDIALGNLGGWRTVLVRSGISGDVEPDSLPPRQRPDLVIEGVGRLLERL